MGSRVLLVALVLGAAYAGSSAYGASRWASATRTLRGRLDAARTPEGPRAVDLHDLYGLPGPVERYLRAALTDGQPIVTGATIRHTGTFNLSEAGERWAPFTSEQWVATRRPGFVWEGRVAVAPGLPVRVHDAYVAGEGRLHASVLGLVSVADLRGGGDLAAGELMRYLAEAVWYPTTLLPGQGVSWLAGDDHSATATLVDGDVSVTLRFTFDARGLVETVEAEARGRTVNGEVVPTPWRGRFWGYEARAGMQVPTDDEVAWLLPDGAKPYWRGHLAAINYDLAR
ncbi:DUF6920 family protein [Rubrivirga sp. IMCC43871]|uniref:DUF6920 family protein n=1 Tax=Rubrivirga sp. IMCC43871 TaxID=3391575 RepID=UPI0039903709